MTAKQPSSYPCPVMLQGELYVAVRQHPTGSWNFDMSLAGPTRQHVEELIALAEGEGLERLERQISGPIINIARAEVSATVRPSDCRHIPEFGPDPLSREYQERRAVRGSK